MLFYTKKLKKKVNSSLKRFVEKLPIEKHLSIFGSSISNFFATKNLYKQSDVEQKKYLKDIGLLVVKNNLPIQFVESVWLKRLCMHLCIQVKFPS
jgi:hypothetical protein